MISLNLHKEYLNMATFSISILYTRVYVPMSVVAWFKYIYLSIYTFDKELN